MRVYVHFSSKFLNINFQYLKTKIYFYSLKTCISSSVEVMEGKGGYSSLPRAPSSVNTALLLISSRRSISRSFNLQSAKSILWTFFMFSGTTAKFRRPECSASSVFVRPRLKSANHLSTTCLNGAESG